MITFSIVTVTYNAASVILPTLESVEHQNYPHVEHIIVDGASTDDTMAVVKDYADRMAARGEGKTVRVVSEPDKGIYDAMNKGLGMVTGDYVCFLNAGDRLPDEGTLDKIAKAAESDTDNQLPAVIYGDTDIVDHEGRFLSHRHLSVPDHLTWKSFMMGMRVCHQAFYARTDIARSTPYDLSYRLSADVDWCIRVMRKAEEEGAALVRAEGVVAYYLKEGQTTKHHKASLRERFDVMSRHYGRLTTIALHAWFVVRALWSKV